MSWLSSLVARNAGVITGIGSAVGLGAPAAAVVAAFLPKPILKPNLLPSLMGTQYQQASKPFNPYLNNGRYANLQAGLMPNMSPIPGGLGWDLYQQAQGKGILKLPQKVPPITGRTARSSGISILGQQVVSTGDTTTTSGTARQPMSSVAMTQYHQRGVHPNKAPNRVTGQPAGSYLVANRRMNPGNGSAVKRAVRRLRAFHKLAVRVERSLHIGRATSHRRWSPPARRSR